MAKVVDIVDDASLEEELTNAGNKLVVVDFLEVWCGQCGDAVEICKIFANKYSFVFLKVDVDKCQETKRKYDVKAMPTFIFFKNKKQIDLLKGANRMELEQAIKKHLLVKDEKSVAPGLTSEGATATPTETTTQAPGLASEGATATPTETITQAPGLASEGATA